MSASNKKELRKQEAASAEAKKTKVYTMSFWIVIVLCVCITLGSVLVNPVKNVIYKNTVAVQVGDYEVNAVELNYFYVDAISTFYNNYSSYISYMLDTKAPLGDQTYNSQTGESWADYFITLAHTNIKSTYAVYELAMEKGFTLSEEEQTSLNTTITYLSLYAALYGYKDADAYLVGIYGNGASVDSYREYYEKCMIAQSYYNEYSESLEYDAAALSAYDQDHSVEFNSYTYAYYYLAVSRFYEGGTKGEDGKITYSDEEKAEAVQRAKEAAESLAAGNYADLDAFDFAIDNLPINKPTTEDKTEDKAETQTVDLTEGEENADGEGNVTDDENNTTEGGESDDNTTEGGESDDNTTEGGESGDNTTEGDKEEEKPTYKYSSTKKENELYSKITSLLRDWIVGLVKTEDDGDKKDEGEDKEEDKKPVYETRTEGELTVIPYTSGEGKDEVVNGYYVVRYGSMNDNTMKLQNVRHILILFKDANNKTYSDGTKTFTEAQKKTAKDKMDKIVEEWEASDKTEEAFGKLADKHSEDGDGTTGGLYEDIYPGQMVTNFDKWCFDEARKTGDYEVVETEYGYHLMYYVDASETNYRDYMITETLRAEDTEAWYNALVDAMNITTVTTKFVNKDQTMA